MTEPFLRKSVRGKRMKRKTCRECVNFVRVDEQNANALRLRGFCKFGCHEGDWSLFVAYSKALNCESYNYDRLKKEAIKREERISDLNFKRKISIPLPQKHDLRSWLKKQEASFSDFRIAYREEISLIKNSRDLTLDEYHRVLDKMSVFLEAPE